MNKKRLKWIKIEYVYVIVISILFGCLFWVIDGIIEFLYFRDNLHFLIVEGPQTYLESIILKVSPHGLFVRFSFIVASILGGILVSLFIYKRRKVEKALSESEEKFSTLFQTSPVYIAFLGFEDGRFVEVNDAFTEITGYQREEVLGRTPVEIGLWSDPEKRPMLIKLAQQQGGFREEEVRFHRKNGELLLGLWSAEKIELGGKNCLVSVIVDVTEREKTNDALRESEKEYSSILNGLLVGVVVHANDTSIVFSNPEAENILGLTYEQMSGKKAVDPVWNFVHADSTVMKGEDYPVSRVLSTKSSLHDYVVGINRPDRDYVTWVIVNAIPVFSKDNELERVVVNFGDITSHRQAEEALRESEEKYRSIFYSVTDALLVIDYDGKIIDANPQACEMYGYSQEEMIGLPGKKSVHPDYYFVFGELKKNVEEKGEFFAEAVHLRKGGHSFNIEVRAGAFLYKGKQHLLVVVRDVSERKKAEEERVELETQLQRAQKMEAIGALAGGVAHDLNNILSGLVGYPELLLLQLPEDSPLSTPVLAIQKSGEKAAAVVQDLLTLARRGVVVSEVVNLNDVISEYLKSPEHEKLQSHHPGVHLETRLRTDTLNILGSYMHLSKTVMNLIFNAAEAMPEGGKLTVSTENRYIDRPIRGYDNVKEGDYAVLTISDTGTGISPDHIDKIFEPFYTKKKMGKSGTGLGLAVVWGTVKDHNGYIDVKSTEGEGTTFTLYFPVARRALPEEESNLDIESYSGDGESILIVDDVQEQREIATRMLMELGYSVSSVSNGEEAIEYLKSHKVDLLVLDMIMDPGLDGLDTYKKIIEIHPWQKAIIVSGFSETARVREAQSLGAGAYVRKPLMLEKMGRAIRQELEK